MGDKIANVSITAESIAAIGQATSSAVRESHVSDLAVKAPPFRELQSDPDAWFTIIEASFATAKITVSETKFQHVIRFLDATQVKQISDLLPSKDFAKLKARLTRLYGLTDKQRRHRYWTEESLGDRTPSELFIELISLVSPLNIPRSEVLLRWKSRLPLNIQNLLDTLPSTTTEDNILDVADNVHENTKLNKQFHTASVNKPFTVSSKPKKINKPSTPRRAKPSTQRESGSSSKSLCWYHAKFGDTAKKCIKGCPKHASGNVQQ